MSKQAPHEFSNAAFPPTVPLLGRFWPVLRHALVNRALEIVAPAAIFALLFLTWKFKWHPEIGSDFANWKLLNDPVDATTLAIAVVLLLATLSTRWRESLPQTVTVCFVRPGSDPGSSILALSGICCQVPLASSLDTRAWSQQTGRQMFSKDLKFLPLFEQPQTLVVRAHDDKIQCWRLVFVYLTEDPVKDGTTVVLNLARLPSFKESVDSAQHLLARRVAGKWSLEVAP